MASALEKEESFNFERDVLPEEFKGLLEKERRVIDVSSADVELVKAVIDTVAQKTSKDAKGGLGV